MWSIGVANIIAQFVELMASCYRQEAETRQFFATSDYIMIALTNHQDAWIFGSGNFCADRQQTDGRTQPITLPLVHVRGVI